MLNRLRQMLIKEFIQVLRDERARFALVVPPLIQMLVFGYAATFELQRVPMAVLNLDHSYESRELVSRFISNSHFDLEYNLDNRRQITDLIDRGKITLAVQILPGFAEDLRKGQTAPMQVILDGTNSNTALVALGYINQIAITYAQQYGSDYLGRIAPAMVTQMPSVTFERRPWYNPNLESQWFFVPGTIGSLIMTSIVTLAAFAIVREREIGTLEQVMVTPITPFEFILGKTIPFFLISMAQLVGIMLVGVLWFQVPFRGSIMLLTIGTVIFILAILGVALFLSTISSTQQQVMVAAFFFIMPAISLSGFTFPISSMPPVMQWITYLDPLRYYLVIIRSSFLKGTGIGVLWPQFAALTVMAAALLGFSVARFHKSID